LVPADDVALEEARRRAHRAWDELLDTMIDYRFGVDPADTPRMTVKRLIDTAELVGAAAAGAGVLGSAEEQARYARRPMSGDGLPAALDEVRRAVSTRVSRRTRLVALLLPPSLLHRWRGVVVLRGTASINRTARARDRILTVVSPRRLMARANR
jgi:hypothetical protein